MGLHAKAAEGTPTHLRQGQVGAMWTLAMVEEGSGGQRSPVGEEERRAVVAVGGGGVGGGGGGGVASMRRG